MPYTSPAAIVSGTVISKSTFGDVVKADLDYLANPPACRVYHNVSQSVATSGAFTKLAMNSERYDTNSMHDTVTLNTRITMNTAGLYVVGGLVDFANNVTGERLATILLNNTVDIAGQRINADTVADTILNPSAVWKFAAGDYIELRAFQTSGGALNVLASSGVSCEFWATWIGLG